MFNNSILTVKGVVNLCMGRSSVKSTPLFLCSLCNVKSTPRFLCSLECGSLTMFSVLLLNPGATMF